MYQGMITLAMSCLIASSVCPEAESPPGQVQQALPASYASYLQLSQNLQDSDTEQIKNYLETAKDTPYARYIRSQWLKKLITEKRWQEFLVFYNPSNDAAIECGYLRALYHTGKQNIAIGGVKRLWLVGHSQPKQCDEIFELWQQSESFTTDLIWQRFELAIQSENYRLAQHLMTQLPEEDQKNAELWLSIANKPKLMLQTTFKATPMAQKIITTGLQRLADRNPSMAIAVWGKVQKKHVFTEQQEHKIIRAIALELALRHKDHAQIWFEKLDIDPNDTVIHEWRIRNSLSRGDWAGLKKHIELLPDNIKQKSCWQYWYARALYKMGQKKQAKAIFARLSRERHYYGFLSSEHLDQQSQLHHKEVEIDQVTLHKIKNHANVKLAKQHLDNKNYKEARTAWHHALKQFDEHEKYHAAKLAADWGWHEQAILTAKRLEHRDDLNLRFPTPHKAIILDAAKKNRIHPAFLYAIIRQESSFQHDAHSPTGARGVMQLLPETAADYQHIMKSQLHPALLYNIDHNVILGARHIKRMLKKFRGKYTFVAASYNAGQSRIKRWLRQSSAHDITIWIDTLPWAETRNYVKNVLTYFVIYQSHLGEESDIGDILKVQRYYD